MNTRARGDEAEAAVLHAFVRCGLSVWLPWSRSGPADLLVENDSGDVVRAQVKSGRVREECVLANCRTTDHGIGRRTYEGCADILVVHAAVIDSQFAIPVQAALGFELRFRLSPPRNNQQSGVRYARDYRLDDWARRFREGIAQAALPAAA